MPDLSNFGQFSKLREDVEYGRHIALRCKDHPDLRWSTKNIAPIGARSIFFLGHKDKEDDRAQAMVRECDCPGSKLEVVPAGEQ